MRAYQYVLRLWKDRRTYLGTTLQGRLILCLSLVGCGVILLFTLLLLALGITGSDRQTVHRYLNSELSHISNAVETDFGNLSAVGIRLAQNLSRYGDSFFQENGMTAADLPARPDVVEPLLDRQMSVLLSVSENHPCGGVFLILDASASTESAEQNRRAGIFLKKTQPVSTASLTAKNYCLRGPASLSREYGVELLGQWKMEFTDTELDFFHAVLQTARENPALSLSRLYFWSDRICLEDNSESGILLCIPLRSADGTVWGACGIEISDRMFKQLYNPGESEYRGVFTALTPNVHNTFFTDRGLIAGNAYLTDSQTVDLLIHADNKDGFPVFMGDSAAYGGLYRNIRLYSSDSPYSEKQWAVTVLMPEDLLKSAASGSSAYLFIIVFVLMILSFAASVFVSKRYLNPIQRSLSSIREIGSENGVAESGIAEIDGVFEDLARNIRNNKETIERLVREKKNAEVQYEQAQAQINLLAERKMQELSPDQYETFLKNLNTLTATERSIFDLYLEGKTTEEILEARQIKENTLKFHNRNIFSKLGVTSRKQLIQLATAIRLDAK